jgi:hypothetical protein
VFVLNEQVAALATELGEHEQPIDRWALATSASSGRPTTVPEASTTSMHGRSRPTPTATASPTCPTTACSIRT